MLLEVAWAQVTFKRDSSLRTIFSFVFPSFVFDVVWWCAQEGYSPNDADDMGNTATHLAAANGHEVRPAQQRVLQRAANAALHFCRPPLVVFSSKILPYHHQRTSGYAKPTLEQNGCPTASNTGINTDEK